MTCLTCSHARAATPPRRRPAAPPPRRASTPISWPVDDNGYHDVIITANTSDGFTRRYAGRIA